MDFKIKMVYETVPEDQLKEFGNRNALLQFLEKEKGKFYRARMLAAMFGFRTTGTQIELRQIITEFIEQKHPIISTAQGFSYANNKQQIQFYISQLESRIKGIQRRIISLKKCMGGMEDGNK